MPRCDALLLVFFLIAAAAYLNVEQPHEDPPPPLQERLPGGLFGPQERTGQGARIQRMHILNCSFGDRVMHELLGDSDGLLVRSCWVGRGDFFRRGSGDSIAVVYVRLRCAQERTSLSTGITFPE